MSKESADGVAPRVWQACVTCRRKKIKCDGNIPCHNCCSRDLMCEYPGSNDNASSSRNYAIIFEARFQQLDTLCQRLEAVTSQLTSAIEKLPTEIIPSPRGSATAVLEGVSQDLQSILEPLDSASSSQQSHTEFAASALSEPGCAFSTELEIFDDGQDLQGAEVETEGEMVDESPDFSVDYDPTLGTFGSLVPDSYGSLRFIGGASNELLVQAIQSLTPPQSEVSESPAFALERQTGAIQKGGKLSLEIPLFVHGLKWRELPYLPKPDDLSLPPRYVADMLVGLYFDQFHYTFPVLYKPHFIESYRRLYTIRKETTRDRGFLSVLFSVCACASSLIASDGNLSTFSGIEFYEKALLLHFSTTGQANIERTQSLALMSMCCSGWNTLSSSWHFAGQAVRAAQDLGMHMSKLTSASDNPEKATDLNAAPVRISGFCSSMPDIWEDPKPPGTIADSISRKDPFNELNTRKNCISAARSCINAAELVRDVVPPSHYLALSVHCLTISGLVLLWMKDDSSVDHDPDVEKCVRFLQDLEVTWSGASRGRVIIEQTMKIFETDRQASLFDLDPQVSIMLHIPTPDLLNLDHSGAGFTNF
ncbi:Zn(II)2Cys6 transcription factor [Fusarium albosuccineum]|uniref:Zn(II)2Cys6 transcription factor n=1 Tax=Fusarium albosuccineum TaxID=1237068 RepID=A0A8H4P878_9HYPO|nr:Zn(II)2Cys6 transcription factor [Fusarium albosuccineum]